MKRGSLWLFVLFLASGIIYYFLTGNFMVTGNSVKVIDVTVAKVLDGDTIQDQSGQSYRLLGINAPEKKTLWSNESANFVRQVENKTVRIEVMGKDKYNRGLGYIFYNGKMINEESLKNGFAHVYIYNEDKYSDRLRSAELIARQKEIGIWKKSPNYGCLILEKFKYLEDGQRCTNKEQIILNNTCGSVKIYLKDDATAHAEYIDLKNGVFSKNFSCVFNDEGDSLYIWDNKGLLVFERYL